MRYCDLKYYFAERLVELYNWDSIDSYRVRSHNAFTLIKELLEVTDNWLKKNIKDFDRVIKCAEETLSELKCDEVIDFSFYSKELFEADLDALIRSDKNRNQETCQQVIYLMSRCVEMNEDCYLDALYYRISQTIRCEEKIADGNMKKEIDCLDRLTMALACQLIYEGYSQRHLYNNSLILQESVDNFEQAFSTFKENHQRLNEMKTYDIVFKVLGGNNQKVLTLDGFIEHVPMEWLGEDVKQSTVNFCKTHGNWIFYHQRVKAHDSVTAISMAKDLLDFELDRAVLGYSMLEVKMNRMALVVIDSLEGKYCMVRPVAVLDTYYADDASTAVRMKEQINHILSNEYIANDVKDRLKSALRHLRMGNIETDAGQKLVNYWVALEFLFSSPKSSESTISRLENNLVNILSCSYVKRRMFFLNKKQYRYTAYRLNLPLWNNDRNGIDDLIMRQKTLLMRHHLMQVKRHLYGHSDKAEEFVTMHRKHLTWQIYRIYRYRNQLIHEAAILPGLDNVIRCLHFYLVFVLDQMIGYFTHSRLKSLNMDGFFYEYEQAWKRVKAVLKADGMSSEERLRTLMNVPLYQDLVKSK